MQQQIVAGRKFLQTETQSKNKSDNKLSDTNYHSQHSHSDTYN